MVRNEYGSAVEVFNAAAHSDVLFVCEHASNHVPTFLRQSGIAPHILETHVAWDPGALAVARHLALHFDAPLVYGGISRLVYDCNRPPHAPDAIPQMSEIYPICFNENLNDAARQERIDAVFTPFSTRLAQVIEARAGQLALIITIHSFTPVYNGQARSVELGVLHGKCDEFAQSMMSAVPGHFSYDVRLNQPYCAKDGVAHTLDHHGWENGVASVMLEIRNDLISTAADQAKIAQDLAQWILAARDDPGDKRPRG